MVVYVWCWYGMELAMLLRGSGLIAGLKPVPDNGGLPRLSNHVLPLLRLRWARSVLGCKRHNIH